MPALVDIPGDNVAELLRDLQSGHSNKPEIRAPTAIRERNVQDRALCRVVDGWQIILAAGGGAVRVLIAWPSDHAREMSVKLIRDSGGSLRVTAKGAKDLDAADVHEMMSRNTQLLGHGR
jgi:hypothetical protein